MIYSEAVALLKEIKEIEDNVDYDKLFFMGGHKKAYFLKNFRTLEKLLKDIYNGDMTIDEAEIKQNEFTEELDKLKTYPARESKYIDLKENVFKNANNFYEGWKENFYRFKNEILSLSVMDGAKTDSGDQQPDTWGVLKQEKFRNSLKQIKEEQRDIDMDLFEKNFGYETSDKMAQVS